VDGVTNIESSFSTRHGDPLKGPLFTLAHYQAFLKTITQAPIYIFPSLTNDIHIVGLLSEITHTFDHLSTQLAQVGLRVNVSKCKLWSPSKISLGIKIYQIYTLVTNGLRILGV